MFIIPIVTERKNDKSIYKADVDVALRCPWAFPRVQAIKCNIISELTRVTGHETKGVGSATNNLKGILP